MKAPWIDRLPPRRRKQILWAAGLILFYTVFGFFILPPIVRSIAVKQASKGLHREVSIEKVKLNPFTFSATIRGVLVKDRDGEPFVSWEEVYANFQLSSIFSGGWDFKEFRLKSPYARVQINRDGTLNFSDLLVSTNPPSAQTGGKSRPLRVGGLRLTNVVVSFADLSLPTPFSTRAGIVELVVDHFSTSSDNENLYSFAGTSADGESFSWKGSFLLDPLRSEGEFSFGALTLKKYKPYHEGKVRFDIRDGKVDATASYRIALGGASNLLQITNGSVTLKDLKIADKGAETNVVEIPLTLVSGAQCDLFGQMAEVKQFSTKNAWFDVRRLKGGKINLAEWFTPLPAKPAPATNSIPVASSPAANPAAWLARIGTIYLQDYAFSFEDLTTPRPVHLDLDRFTVALTNISNQPGTNTAVDLSLRWNTNGTIKIDGVVGLFPPSGQLSFELRNIELLPLDRYLDEFVNLAINRGALGVKGAAKFAMPSNAPIQAAFKGDVHITDFASREIPAAVEVAKWRNLALRGLDFELGPPAVATIEELFLDQPFIRLAKDARTNNLAAIVKAQAVSTNTPERMPEGHKKSQLANPGKAGVTAPVVQINELEISKGVVQFSDVSHSRPVQMLIEDLGLKLRNVSNQPGTNIGWALALRLNTNGLVKT